MLACAFFHVDCAATLQRIYVFFVLEVPSRSVHLLGTTTNLDGRWITQQIRNLVMDLGDRVTQFRFLVRDGAGQFAASFDAVLADVGIQVVRIPPVARERTVSPNGSSHRQSRTYRPHAGLQPATPAWRAHGIRSPLQRSTTPPRPQPSPTTANPPCHGPQP
jgi:hypothetical protein